MLTGYVCMVQPIGKLVSLPRSYFKPYLLEP